jgi:chromosomal replication initiation ATPase DnaA
METAIEKDKVGEAAEGWPRALGLLENLFTEVIYESIIKPLTPYALSNNMLVLKCEKDFFKPTINQRYISEITRCVRSVMGPDIEIRIV